jgi:tetratricopeptide (TPR) repeat protein
VLAIAGAIWLVACTHSPSVQSTEFDSQSERTFSDSIEQHKQLGKRYEAAGDLAAAATQWHILTLIAPEEESFRLKLAATKNAISRAVNQTYQSGLAALRKGEMEEAWQAMLRVLALAPDNAEAAQALRDIEKQRIGRIQAERAARVRRGEWMAANRWAPSTGRQSYDLDQPIDIFMAGDITGGLREMRRYVESNPDDKAGRHRIANVVYEEARKLEGQGVNESALGFYEQAASLRGEVPPTWGGRIKALRKVLASEYYDKGLRAYRSDIALAVRYWETCLRYEPQHVNAALRLREARLFEDKLKRIEREKTSQRL